MSVEELFKTALAEAKAWHASLPQASQFCDWPSDIHFEPRPAHLLAATELISERPGYTPAASKPLLSALQALAPHLEWRHTYTADQVGQHFLDHYGWFELAGPEGHFITRQTRITGAYWGPGLHYGRHQHEPEELYTVVSGGGVFHVDNREDQWLGPGESRYHASNQPHAMTMKDEPIVTLVFWRGRGLADPPRMTE
ncbi:MAG: dimethylsulfonioproprionate lyase family protein [Pseudomonadota bacterium]